MESRNDIEGVGVTSGGGVAIGIRLRRSFGAGTKPVGYFSTDAASAITKDRHADQTSAIFNTPRKDRSTIFLSKCKF